MSPLVPSPEMLGDAPVRSVGGLGQVMHAESRYVSTSLVVTITILHQGGMFIFGMVLISSRDAYAQLTTAPILKPLDWTRSRVRREHLISMGVPVNLDEVCPFTITSPPARHQKGHRKEELTKGRFSSYISPTPTPNYHSRRTPYSITRCARYRTKQG